MKNKKKIIITVLVIVVLTIAGLVVFNNVSYAVDENSTTVYKDYSSINNVDYQYSFSNLFLSPDSTIEKIKVPSSTTGENQKIGNIDLGKKYILKSGDELILLITKSATDNEGNLYDALIKLTDVNIWNDVQYHGDDGNLIGFAIYSSYNFLTTQNISNWNWGTCSNGNTQIACQNGDNNNKPNISIGEPLRLALNANCADVDFSITYYKTGTYNKTTNTGTLATKIKKINAFLYDFDIAFERYSKEGYVSYYNDYKKATSHFLRGNEGISPNNSSTIYYNKNRIKADGTEFATTDNYHIELSEIDNGIAVTRNRSTSEMKYIQTDGIWYQSSIFMLSDTNDSSLHFRYGGLSCGLSFLFASPYPYTMPAPVKEVVNKKEKYYPGDAFTYKISQYVPNNGYVGNIGFHEVYESIPETTRYTSFKIYDELNGYLTLEDDADVRVENEANVKQTKFTINKDDINYVDNIIGGGGLPKYYVEATANQELLQESSFYGHTYSLFIPVKIKSSGVLTKEIPNVATTTIQEPGTPEPIEQETPEVKVDVYFKVTTYYYKEGTTEQLISPVVESDKQNGDSYTTNSQPSNLDSKWELVPSATTVSPSSQGTSGTINGSNVVVKYYYKLADKYARLKKTDPKGNFVIGAKLAVYDGNTKVAEWTTKKGYDSCNLAVQTTNEEAETTGCNVITPVTANKTYTVKEEVTPVGYATSPDGSLVIDANGNSESGLTIVNPPIKVCVMTVDGNDKPITGIEVEIRNKLGSKYKDFISSEQWYCMDQVPVGDYELEETKLVGEYEKSPIQKETVKNTSETQYIKIINQLKVPKTSLDTTRILGIIGIVFGMFGVSLFVILKYKKKNN